MRPTPRGIFIQIGLNELVRKSHRAASCSSWKLDSRSVLAIGAAVPHHIGMSSSDARGEGNDGLAQDARPLRQSLARYFGRRLRDSSDVDDLVQEVFARVVSRDSTTPIAHLGRYLHQTAASVLADYARRRSARRFEAHVPFDPDVHGESDFDPERIVAGRQDVALATAALLSLPERTRTIFVLRRLDGVPAREVASRVGVSVSAVEKHMVRAVRHLSAAMGAVE
jgi:RNA polymerase sigma-70 factor (ECF subfamily)